MIKISISFSKKVPGSAEYSSDGFLCALESEVSDSALNNPRELKERALFLWNLAKQSVEEQISNGNSHKPAAGAPAPAAPVAIPAPARAPEAPPQNGDGPATSRQVKFVVSLAQRDHAMKLAELATYLRCLVGQEDVHKLTKSEASRVIEELTGKGVKA